MLKKKPIERLLSTSTLQNDKTPIKNEKPLSGSPRSIQRHAIR